YSRRSTWELLQKHKAGRVMLLTTHFMDEADTLADRIAIMSDGMLLCSGSSLFLKRRFGAGYLLTCCKVSTDTPIEAMDEEVKTIIPLATLVSAVAGEVVYGLPLISTHSFHILFASLDSNKDRLGLKSFGVSVTSLEHVFLSLARSKEQSQYPVHNHNPVLCDYVLRWLCLSKGASRPIGQQNIEETWFSCLHRCYSNEPRLHSAYDVETGMEMKDLAGEQENMETASSSIALPPPPEASVLSLSDTGGAMRHPPVRLGRMHSSSLLLQGNASELVPPAPRRKTDGIAKVRFCAQFHHLFTKRALIASRDLKGFFFQVIFPALQVLLILLLLSISPKPRGRSISMNGDMFKTYGGIDASLVIANTNNTSGLLGGEYTVDAAPSSVGDSTALSYWLLNRTHFEDSRYGAYVFNDSVPVSLTIDWSWLSMQLSNDGLQLPINASSTDDYVLQDDIIRSNIARNITKQLGPFGPSPSIPGLEFLYLQYLLSGGTGTGNYNFTVQRPYTVLHNTTSPHAIAAWQGELVQQVFQTCTGNPTASYIVHNHPIPQTRSTLLKNRVFLSLLTSIFILVPLSQSPASYVAFVVKEKATKCTHLQMASGVSPSIYWLSTYFWDMTSFIVLALCVLVAFFVVGPGNASVFVGTSETSTCVLLLILSYGASAIPLNYIYSFAFDNFSTAQITVMLINFMTGFVLVLAHYVMQVTPDLQSTARVLVHLFRFFPGYLLGEALINLTTAYLQNTLRGRHISVFTWTVAGRSLAFMLLEAVGYLGLVLLSESALIKELTASRHLHQASRYLPCPPPKRDPDDDVVDEEKRVQSYLAALHTIHHSKPQARAVVSNPATANQAANIEPDASDISRREYLHYCRSKVKHLALLISDLVKVYVPLQGDQPKYSVRGLSLACMEGERFGLLGINGAGKTTTLSVLTGESVASSG
ncbi:ATP-binding cassette domain-containing protein, partial [archaeon]